MPTQGPISLPEPLFLCPNSETDPSNIHEGTISGLYLGTAEIDIVSIGHPHFPQQIAYINEYADGS